MRILFDMQGAQTPGSRHRGVGRYSHALIAALLQCRPDWEYHMLLNNFYIDSSIEIQKKYSNIVEKEHFHMWAAVEHCRDADTTGHHRRQASKILRNLAIERVQPNIVINTSVFEGFLDDALVNVSDNSHWMTASILYDLIPLIFKDMYLKEGNFSQWYYKQIAHLKKSDILLSISDSSTKDAISLLGFPADNIYSIYGAADHEYQSDRGQYDVKELEEIKSKLGIAKSFILYTGGNEQRKNIDFLIRSFSAMDPAVQANVDLVIVCNIDNDSRIRLLRQAGLRSRPSNIVFTGFISDPDLMMLYRACALFVFPSLYEGLGLPILEAACCDAPIVASRSSSMAEIVETEQALFDPYDSSSCTSMLERALQDDTLRQLLRDNSRRIALKYRWEATGLLAAKAIETAFGRWIAQNSSRQTSAETKLTIAHVSPYAPMKTGIAEYSGEISAALYKKFEVEIVSEQDVITSSDVLQSGEVVTFKEFERSAWGYDHIIYHIGNAHFHWQYLKHAILHPGIVILHDVYLSGVISYMGLHEKNPTTWFSALRSSHGLGTALRLYDEDEWSHIALHDDFPASYGAIEYSTGVILHSKYAQYLVEKFYGSDSRKKTKIFVHPRVLPSKIDKKQARAVLGFSTQETIVCSFGFLSDTKFSEELLGAWFMSKTWQEENSKFIFVGMCGDPALAERLRQKIIRHNAVGRVVITGFADPTMYKQYLQAADCAVQLRRFSRGETSGTIADCLAYGVATLINANGSLGETPDEAVYKLPDQFSEQQLVSAIDTLCCDREMRTSLAEYGRKYIKEKADPDSFANELQAFLLTPNQSTAYWRHRFVRTFLRERRSRCNAFDADVISKAVSVSFPAQPARQRVVLDVSYLMDFDLISSEAARDVGKLIVDGLAMQNSEVAFDVIAAAQQDMVVNLSMLRKVLGNARLPSFGLSLTLAPTDAIIWSVGSAVDEASIPKIQQAVAAGAKLILLASRAMLTHALTTGVPSLVSLKKLAPISTMVLLENKDTLHLLKEVLGAANIERKASVIIRWFKNNSGEFVGSILELLHAQRPETDFLEGLTWFRPPHDHFHVVSGDIHVGVGLRFGKYAVSQRIAGHLTYGPYRDLEIGKYAFKLLGCAVDPRGAFVELLWNDGVEHVIATAVLGQSEESSIVLAELKFSSPVKIKSFEARVCVFSESVVLIESYELLQLGG